LVVKTSTLFHLYTDVNYQPSVLTKELYHIVKVSLNKNPT